MKTETKAKTDIARKNDKKCPKLTILVKRKIKGIPLVEGLRMAEERGLVIASNKRLDMALVESNEWKNISEVFPCRSGTMTAYVKPGEKFGNYVTYTNIETYQRYVFPVPEDYKGIKNAILVVENPEYTLEKDGKDLVVAVKNIENIGLIRRFPPKDGWYPTDEKYGIPTGNKVGPSDPNARYLERTNSLVGPTVRGSHIYGYFDGRVIVLYCRSSYSLGIAVEAP